MAKGDVMKIVKILMVVIASFLILATFCGCKAGDEVAVKKDSDNVEINHQKDDFELFSKVIYAPPQKLDEGSQADFDNLTYRKGHVPVIAYMPPATEFDYYIGIGEGIKSLANDLGAEVFMIAPESGSDIQTQIQMLQDVIKQKVDIIILSTHDEDAIAPSIKSAVDSGIVVVIVNSDSLKFPTPIHAVVGYNQRNGTKKLGNYVSMLVGKADINVGIIEGQSGWHSSERVGGFSDAISGKDNFNIVASLDGQWNIEGGKLATMEMLEAHPEIQLLFAANDYEIMGAQKVTSAIGREDILLFGNDGDTACLEEIAAGNIDATVHTAPYEMGIVALQVAVDGLAGIYSGGYVETPTIIVDKYSVFEFLSRPDALYPKPVKEYNSE